MRKLLTASLPALALLALGGCTATRPVATTEDDGVYYSSSHDRTTAVAQPAAPAPAQSQAAPSQAAPADGDAANPDYQGSANNQRRATNNPEYYDDGYAGSSYNNSSIFRRPYAGPAVGLDYYTPPPIVFAPSLSYGWGSGACGYSPYGSAFYDPFYSPYSSLYASPYYGSFYSPYALYSPFGYGYGGSYFSLGFSYGFGRPYYGGYGAYGYGRPYYGGYGGYDPYYGYGNNYYGNNYYGGNNYGGNSYYSRPVVRPYGNSVGANNGGAGSPVLVGRRGARGGDVLAGRDSPASNPGSTAPVPPTTGRRGLMNGPSGGIVAPTTPPRGGLVGVPDPTAPAPGSYGRRGDASGTYQAPNRPTELTDHDQPAAGSRLGRVNGVGNPGDYQPSTTAPGNPDGQTRGRWRRLDDGSGATTGPVSGSAPGAGRGYEQPQQPEAQPQVSDRPSRRSRLFGSPDGGQGQGNPGGYGQAMPQPQPQYQPQPQQEPQRTYERPQRTYEQPAYSQPEPQRTYERPSYSQPSNSQPSYGGGNSGGGNSGGGNSGGGNSGGGNGGGGGGRRGRF